MDFSGAYPTIKFVHILLAIVAIGFNATYGIWISHAARHSPKELGFALRGVKRLDDRWANPAYGLLFVTGLAMVLTSGIPLTTFWIMGAIVLLAALAVGGFGLYSPTLRRQIRLFETVGADNEEFRGLMKRGMIIGISLAVIAIAIMALMVYKPTI